MPDRNARARMLLFIACIGIAYGAWGGLLAGTANDVIHASMSLLCVLALIGVGKLLGRLERGAAGPTPTNRAFTVVLSPLFCALGLVLGTCIAVPIQHVRFERRLVSTERDLIPYLDELEARGTLPESILDMDADGRRLIDDARVTYWKTRGSSYRLRMGSELGRGSRWYDWKSRRWSEEQEPI